MRLLIVDCHPMLREGLAVVARASVRDLAIDTTSSLADALTTPLARALYHTIITGCDLPDAQGLAAVTQLKRAYPSAGIALLSEKPTAESIAAARRVGAAGWLDTTWTVEQLTEALFALLAGCQVFPARDMSAGSEQATANSLDQVSNAQVRVLLALASGSSNKQIAFELGITEATVKAHLSASFRKLGVRNRAQALLAIKPLTSSPRSP